MYAYTRSQAIADGFQIEVTKTAQEARIPFPVLITRGVYEQCVAVRPNGRGQPLAGQDEAGRPPLRRRIVQQRDTPALALSNH